MAEPAANNQIIEVFNSLPPILQGAVVVAVGGAFGIMLYKRFAKRLGLDPSPETPGTRDLVPPKEMVLLDGILKNVDLLTMQLMKNEVALASYSEGFIKVVGSIGQLVDLVGELVTDMKLERLARENEEMAERYRQEGREQAQAEAKKKRAGAKRPPRRAVSKPTV